MTDFDPVSEVATLKAETKMIRKRSYKQRKSRLDKYHTELVAMHKQGATIAELTRWLRKKKAIKVADSTVNRWLQNRE